MHKSVRELEEEEGLRLPWSRLKDSVEMCPEEKPSGYASEAFLLLTSSPVGSSVRLNWRFIYTEHVDDLINSTNGWLRNHILQGIEIDDRIWVDVLEPKWTAHQNENDYRIELYLFAISISLRWQTGWDYWTCQQLMSITELKITRQAGNWENMLEASRRRSNLLALTAASQDEHQTQEPMQRFHG